MTRVVIFVVLLLAMAPPAGAQADSATFDEVSLAPAEGTTLVFGERAYVGTIRVTAAPNGLVVVEDIDVDGYLSGIREVPLSWHEEALAAQVVAARTFLGWTLQRGRSSDARRYDFDICATTSCQVYAGVGVVRGPDGERWAEAISRTAGELLLYQGKPAHTMYHSTSGGRTEPIEDIFGSAPQPYLVGAASPNEPSPYVEWSYEIPANVFVDALRQSRIEVGALESVEVVDRELGEGQWTVRVVSSQGLVELTVSRVRAIMNSFGPRRYPGLLPAPRPGGGRYPQAVLSYRYDITYDPPPSGRRSAARFVPDADIPAQGTLRFEGNGWGHHVGMSQYGALALAESGSGYSAILAHFYGGLTPQEAPDVLPDEVTVGLAWGQDRVVVLADGPVSVVAGGVTTEAIGGAWIASFTDDGRVGLLAPTEVLEQRLSRLITAIPFL